MRVLLIDDEPFYFKILGRPLKEAGYELEYSKTGTDGLAALSAYNPDVLILDLRLPDLSGLEILRRLRVDPSYKHIPVIVITAKDELDDKLKAFELGADDYLVKPFPAEELVARMRALARHGKAMKIVHQMETDLDKVSTVVAVHSLRGGVGCSSLAVNLALAFHQVWGLPTLLVDAVLAAGQVAMMLNANPRATWQDFLDISVNSLDDDMLNELICTHQTGLNYVAAPRFPIAMDAFTDEFLGNVLPKLKQKGEYIVIDTSHDFSDVTIQMLNLSSIILLVIAPEMASLRAALSALNIYDKLGFAPDRVKIALNHNTGLAAIKQAQIEKVLGYPIDFIIPYEPAEMVHAINFGEPFLLKNPDLPISVQVENMAYTLSQDIHKNIPPAIPSQAWKRVTNRMAGKRS